mmetsp:Transcript_2193/g.3741  ORF Transcript_2193/g.3741 Transcript_2193/m.3741 type:complete len:259 (-) Transcript_2193:149-925(-)
MALQPASTTLYAFAGPTPPSISIHGSTPFALHIAFNSLILSTCDSMKPCPPNPGLTDMIKTRSTSSRTYSICDRGVPGFKTTPARQPNCLIWFTVRCKWIVDAASQCTEMMSAPAFAKSSTRCSGSTIMRWQSKIASGNRFLKACTTGAPMVMFGTKRPSITSTCTQSAPASSTSSMSDPSLAKSADKMEGETWTDFFMLRSFSARGFSARMATTCDFAAWERRGLAAAAAKAPMPTQVAAALQGLSIPGCCTSCWTN